MFIRKLFKWRQKLDTSNGVRTINLIGDKRDKYLEGETIIGHCREHGTIIFLHKGFYEQHVRLLSENYHFH